MFLGTVGIVWTILFFICLVQLVVWTLSPRRDKWVRVFCLALVVGAFLNFYVAIAMMIMGAIAWAESRMPN